MGDVLQTLRASVRRKDGGVALVLRGQEVPSDADPDDVKRLRELGHIGDPKPAQVESGAISVASTDEELQSFVSSASADDVVSAAGQDAAFAERLLEAEIASREKPRKTVVEPLEGVIAGEPGEGESTDE